MNILAIAKRFLNSTIGTSNSKSLDTMITEIKQPGLPGTVKQILKYTYTFPTPGTGAPNNYVLNLSATVDPNKCEWRTDIDQISFCYVPSTGTATSYVYKSAIINLTSTQATLSPSYYFDPSRSGNSYVGTRVFLTIIEYY